MDPDVFPNLDPELRDLVALLPDTTTAFEDVVGARELMRSFLPPGPVPGAERLEITEARTDGPGEGVRVRIYRPHNEDRDEHRDEDRDAAGDLPGILYIHGGGFCIGDVDIEDAGAVAVANAVGAVVVSVDYRLAPEHPYPAGLEDCHAALRLLAELPGVDPTRLAVHGQSAGGGLAAATALLARDRGGPALCFQSLGIPELDDRLETPSMRAFTATPMWSRPQAVLSWQYYLGGNPADGYAAPARMEDLGGLPPAYVSTCELDPLRDEGILYAMRMMAAGVSVELHTFPGTVHGSSMVPSAAVVQRMDGETIDALRRALHPEAPSQER
ncbi:alpha/beta hydrolase [Marmoricola sp. RAF53]|uniref:alpha/beta hydrolase n=1 Tax=Marmoricola sp. RAF53 TaxID=3233059 RepID=UPI003F95F671